MTIATTLMGLLKAVGSDNARDYVKTSLPTSLDKLDGHKHDGPGGAALGVTGLDLTTWGPLARSQGLILAPRGTVTDDGAGNLILSDSVIVVSPASGSLFGVASGTYALAVNQALVCDLPPTTADNATVTPTVLAWTHDQRAYDGRDRLVLAYRLSSGPIYSRCAVAASTPVRLVAQTLAAPAANLSIGSIPGNGFSAIEIVGQLRSDYAGAVDKIGLRFNADSTAGHYNGGYTYNDNTTTAKADAAFNQAQAMIGRCACTGAAGGGFAAFRLTIPSYANATYNKAGTCYGTSWEFGTLGNVAVAFQGGGSWNQTPAITTVTLFPILGANWLAGSMWTVTLVP